ncbi:MAG: hypothetical protein PHQ80_03855 [Candidatus ainarchaeum sp.]|nr:hypothetical protein [Candidatus ainarchaeum sp.]
MRYLWGAVLLAIVLAGCISDEMDSNPICDEMLDEVHAHFGAGFVSGPEKAVGGGGSCTYTNMNDAVIRDKVLLFYNSGLGFASQNKEEMIGTISDTNYFRDSAQKKIVSMEDYVYGYSKSIGNIPSQNIILRKGSVMSGVAVLFAPTDKYYEGTLLHMALLLSDRVEGGAMPSYGTGHYTMYFGDRVGNYSFNGVTLSEENDTVLSALFCMDCDRDVVPRHNMLVMEGLGINANGTCIRVDRVHNSSIEGYEHIDVTSINCPS